MKKTMIFENEKSYEKWSNTNEENEGGFDFLLNRVCIINTYRMINGTKFNGFSADATITCKTAKTAVRHFIKEMNANGYDINADDFEGVLDGENLNALQECGMVIEVEEFDEGVFYVNFMCFQDEVEAENIKAETSSSFTGGIIMTYEEFKKTYSYALKHFPSVSSIELDAPITVTVTNQEKINGRWITSAEKVENFTGKNYLNAVETIPFFKNLGGSEKVSKAYTKYGLIPIEIVSTSPDKNERTIRKFSF